MRDQPDDDIAVRPAVPARAECVDATFIDARTRMFMDWHAASGAPVTVLEDVAVVAADLARAERAATQAPPPTGTTKSADADLASDSSDDESLLDLAEIEAFLDCSAAEFVPATHDDLDLERMQEWGARVPDVLVTCAGRTDRRAVARAHFTDGRTLDTRQARIEARLADPATADAARGELRVCRASFEPRLRRSAHRRFAPHVSAADFGHVWDLARALAGPGGGYADLERGCVRLLRLSQRFLDDSLSAALG